MSNSVKNAMSICTFFVTLALDKKGLLIMSEEQMNSYRLTSMEEPGDERMAQIMREVAEDARESTRRAAERVAAGIEAARLVAQEKWGDTINRIKNGRK